jgi:hypothetical protein
MAPASRSARARRADPCFNLLCEGFRVRGCGCDWGECGWVGWNFLIHFFLSFVLVCWCSVGWILVFRGMQRLIVGVGRGGGVEIKGRGGLVEG